MIASLQKAGVTSYRGVALTLKGRGVRAARGGRWQVIERAQSAGESGDELLTGETYPAHLPLRIDVVVTVSSILYSAVTTGPLAKT
jgi:hypothetical protein